MYALNIKKEALTASFFVFNIYFFKLFLTNKNTRCKGKNITPTDNAVQMICGSINGREAIKYTFAARSEKPYQIGVMRLSIIVKHAVHTHATITIHHSARSGFFTTLPNAPNTAVKPLK